MVPTSESFLRPASGSPTTMPWLHRTARADRSPFTKTLRFFQGFTKLIESASKAMKAEHPRVAIFGEGVALLWAKGKRDAAIRLEQLGNDLAKTHDVHILCAYPFSSFHVEEDKQAFKRICVEHSAVYWR